MSDTDDDSMDDDISNNQDDDYDDDDDDDYDENLSDEDDLGDDDGNNDEDNDDDDEDEESMDRMKALLSSYYGSQNKDENKEDVKNIDSGVFDYKGFLTENLNNGKIQDLIKIDKQYSKELSSYDSDMQSLVYENYTKFISATDTIKNMKTHIDEMETEMKSLLETSHVIDKSSKSMSEAFNERRTKIDKLVGVNRMIKNLEQLLDLPVILNRSVDLGAFQQAVVYFTTAKVVLEKYKHVPSFKNLLDKSEKIMEDLKEQLKSELDDNKISINSLSEHIKLLLQLKYDPLILRKQYIEYSKTKLMRRIKLFLPIEQKKYVEVDDSSDNENADPEVVRIKDGQLKTTEIPLLHFIQELDRYFLEYFIQIAHRYVELFPYTVKENEDEINQMTSELFQLYFRAVDAKLQNDVSGINAHNIINSKDQKSLFNDFCISLQQFITDCRTAQSNVPNSGIVECSRGIAESAIQSQLDLSFESFRNSITDLLLELPDKIRGNSGNNDLDSKMNLMNDFINVVMSNLKNTLSNVNGMLISMTDSLASMAEPCNMLFQQHFQQSILWISSVLGCIASKSHPGNFKGKLFGIEQHDKMPYPILPHLYSVSDDILNIEKTPSLILLLLIIIREFQNRGITESLNLLIEYLPNNTSSLIDKRMIHEDIKLSHLIQCLKYSESCLLECYVNTESEVLGKWLNRSVNSNDSNNDVKDISDGIIHYIEELQCVCKDISPLFQVNTYKMEDEPIWILTPFSPAMWGYNDQLNDGTTSPNSNQEEIITENRNKLDTLSFNRDSLLNRVIFNSLKMMLEEVRENIYQPKGFGQIETDISFVRLLLPIFLDDTQIIDNLLLLIMQGAFDRCDEAEEVDGDKIVEISKSSYNLLKWN